MIKKDQFGMQCSQFEVLLSDALDGALTGDILEAFESHGRACPVCGPMLTDAQEGMRWLHQLEEVEPPRNLVHNILAATLGEEAAGEAQAKPRGKKRSTAGSGWLGGLKEVVLPVLTGVVQPRFVTSFAMAFFSLSLTLTLAGVKFKDLMRVDLRPGSLRKAVVLQYTQVENRVVKYYENMRLVYEIESRVRELRKAAGTPQEDGQQQERQRQNINRNDSDDTSKSPEERQDHYSRDLDNSVIASLNMSNEGA